MCFFHGSHPLNPMQFQPAKKPFVGWISQFSSCDDPGSDLNMFPTKPSKIIGPPDKPEGNAMHIVHRTVSPKIALWVTAILRCLQSRNEWEFVGWFFLIHALILLMIQVLLRFTHIFPHACILIHLA
jgi:hypothetical protein